MPREPLPATSTPSLDYAPGSLGNQRYRPRISNSGGVGRNDYQPGYGPSQESNVTPVLDDVDGNNSDLRGPDVRNSGQRDYGSGQSGSGQSGSGQSGLPGPGFQGSGFQGNGGYQGPGGFQGNGTGVDPYDNRQPDYSIPPPPISRASTEIPDFGDFGTGRAPQAVIRRNALDVSAWQPNTSAPGFYPEGPTRMFGNNSPFPSRQATYSTNTVQPGFGTTNDTRFGSDNRNNAYNPNGPSVTTVGITVCALLFSIGLNLFLGWLAWEYYLKYRESFESWRSASRS